MNFPQFLADIFFPRSCLSCEISLPAGVICTPCFAAIPRHTALFCGICDARLAYGKRTCHPTADCMIGGAGPYRDTALKKLVHQLKFKGVREAAIPLAELLTQYLASCNFPARGSFVIIPVPLSKQRERERGFNQAFEIARALSVAASMTMTADFLKRIRNTKPQTETENLEERMKNVHGCFLAASAVAGKNILLVDDVTTSGTTFREAALALRKAGARKIVAIAAAKA